MSFALFLLYFYVHKIKLKFWYGKVYKMKTSWRFDMVKLITLVKQIAECSGIDFIKIYVLF